MAITSGMNPDEVEAMARKIQGQHVEAIRNLVREVEGLVNSTSAIWVGTDAERFRSWWPEKRSRMNAIAEDLNGFGQSALNNAKEQRQATAR